jgi:hypothetical protein
MFRNISDDVFNLIMDMLLLKESLCFMSLNKENKEFKKIYYYSRMIHISGSISNFMISLPNIKYIDIRRRTRLTDDDFQLCNNIQKINMKFCDMSLTTDNIFSHFENLKELNLLHCLKTDSNMTYSDKIFDYLSNLEKFSINYNHVITDQGLEKLVNIKDLSIVACFNITGCGLCNLTSLIKLDLFKIKNLFDYHFKNLINLEELKLSLIHDITSECISQLPKLKKLNCVECRGITSCINFDKLKNLFDVSFNDCSINDNDLIHLKYIKKLYIINCLMIQGAGLKYLLNIEELSIYENPIIDNFIDDIIMLKNIKKLSICNRDYYMMGEPYVISNDRKNQLKQIFGDKFNENF